MKCLQQGTGALHLTWPSPPMSPVRASKKCTTGSATKDNDMGSDMEQGPE